MLLRASPAVKIPEYGQSNQHPAGFPSSHFEAMSSKTELESWSSPGAREPPRIPGRFVLLRDAIEARSRLEDPGDTVGHLCALLDAGFDTSSRSSPGLKAIVIEADALLSTSRPSSQAISAVMRCWLSIRIRLPADSDPSFSFTVGLRHTMR
jgi:hypothetical protein